VLLLHSPQQQQIRTLMNHRPVSLGDFFHDYQARSEPLVLATIIETIGSTYRKAGAQMLIAADGSAAGLLSGGCLEADLVERARRVTQTGDPLVVEYDTRNSDDVLWGIGLGCEGAMRILLTRLDCGNGYEPFAFQERCRRQSLAGSVAFVIATNNPAQPLGATLRSDSAPASSVFESSIRGTHTVVSDDATFLVVPVDPPTRLLVLGAGPDAVPLVEIAGLMGWHVTVLDHRAAYAVADRFPRASHVALNPANALPNFIDGANYDAAVVMSHHLLSDQAYLAALADSSIAYIGLLGPSSRRTRLMSEIGERSALLKARLHGPIGLDIGAQTPETIALAIVAEIQAVLAHCPGGSFSSRARLERTE